MMARRIVPLRQPLYRRIGRLVVRLDGEGVAIRGHGRRRWRRLSWEQVAAFAMGEGESRSLLFLCCEEGVGRKELKEMGAVE